ncbi:hypothetical protein [Actinoplanes sp. NPDC051851]|uniref:hypothetical protein n=1 Tax=Actinoplanes sp. NPDC051851 TaxID=3154753 RepID=UPI003438814A
MTMPVLRRTDVVFPKARAGDLRIPPLALTDGRADPEWVELSYHVITPVPRPALRIPLDPEAAARARRFNRLGPLLGVLLVLSLAGVLVALGKVGPGDGPYLPLVLFPTILGSLVSGLRPKQKPTPVPGGFVRISHVDAVVAQHWMALNPGVVRILYEGIPIRRYKPMVYRLLGVAFLALTAALIAVLLFVDSDMAAHAFFAIPVAGLTALAFLLQGAGSTYLAAELESPPSTEDSPAP